MRKYTIIPLHDLYHEREGKCFTKGKPYTFESREIITKQSQLINVTLTNDLGYKHKIDKWCRYFSGHFKSEPA